jgi:hypothetical protein
MRWTSSLRLSLSFSLCLLLFALPARPQVPAPLGRCGPRAYDPADWPRNPSLEPSASADNPSKLPTGDRTQLRHDAKELADLSASLMADIDQVNRGLLPKDVVEKLKRIEKLSKRLRTELTQ